MTITPSDLDKWLPRGPAIYFPDEEPNENQVVHFQALRAAAFVFACLVVESTPGGRDQELALDNIRVALEHADSANAGGK